MEKETKEAKKVTKVTKEAKKNNVKTKNLHNKLIRRRKV